MKSGKADGERQTAYYYIFFRKILSASLSDMFVIRSTYKFSGHKMKQMEFVVV